MTERIGLKGVLEGISKMLVPSKEDKETGVVYIELTVRMSNAKAMLDGVISELNKKPAPLEELPLGQAIGGAAGSDAHIDEPAKEAKAELTG